ncbi:hypothetical protein N431DRAFT_70455 [Stipitochalara longipes BDJ]|nr:hypothetical protein N431DRAFT_70455 [Stipitochalara longipes BDJ]
MKLHPLSMRRLFTLGIVLSMEMNVGTSDDSFFKHTVHTYIRDIAKSNPANHHVNRSSKVPSPLIRCKQPNQQNRKEIV